MILVYIPKKEYSLEQVVYVSGSFCSQDSKLSIPEYAYKINKTLIYLKKKVS